MSKTFSQESSEAFLNFTKSALRRTKKAKQKKETYQRDLTDCCEKNFEEKTSFIWLLKKETCWHSPISFEYAFS